MGQSYDDEGGSWSFGYVVLDFDWSSIPSNAVIDSVNLYHVSDGIFLSGLTFFASRYTGTWPALTSNVSQACTFGKDETYKTNFTTGSSQSYFGSPIPAALAQQIRSSGGWLMMYRDDKANQWEYEIYPYDNASYKPYLQVDWHYPNTAPNAPSVSMSNGAYWQTTLQPTINWTFSDPDGNPQGGYSVELINGAYSASLWSSGAIADANARSYTLPAGVITGDGTFWLRMRVYDSNGAWNQSNGNSPDPAFGNVSFGVDRTAPTTSNYNVGVTPANIASGGTKNVSIDIGDGLSGAYLSDAYYCKPDGTWVQCLSLATSSGATRTIPVPITTEGTYLVDFYVRDNAGNNAASYPVRLSFIVDRTAPAMNSVTGQIKTNSSATQRFTVNTSDANGIQRVDAYILNFAGTAWSGPFAATNAGSGNWYYDFNPAYEAGNGTHTVRFWSYDPAGNGNFIDSSLVYDTTAPSAPTITPSRAAGSWGATDVTFTLGGSTDSLTGVNRYEYNLNGGAWTTYTGTVTLSTTGATTVNARAVDNVGNVSGTTSATFYIDKVAPTAPTINRSNTNWSNVNVTFTITNGTDANSGVARSEYNLNGGAWTTYTGTVTVSAAGQTTVNARTVDNAGNVSSTTTTTIYIDKVAPTATNQTFTVNTNSTSARLWIYGVADDYSGVNRIEVWRTPPGGAEAYLGNMTKNGATNDYYIDVTLSTQGTYAYRLVPFDNAGNYINAGTANVTYDTTAPTIGSVDAYGYTSATTGTRRVFANNVADSGSGINTVNASYIRPGDGGRTTLTAVQSGSNWYVDVPLSAVQGEWNVQFQAVDRAGNTSSVSTAYFFVDNVAPADGNEQYSITESSVTVTWTGFSDTAPSSGYSRTEFYFQKADGTPIDIDSNGSTESLLTFTDNRTSYTVNNLVPGTQYRCTVVLTDKSGNSNAWSYDTFYTNHLLQPNIGGVWKTPKGNYVNVGGTWRRVVAAWTKVNGTWKK
jgi:hypothetical protein